MSYRLAPLAAAVAAFSMIQIASTAAQSVYVAPGGIYIGAGSGPVYLTPSAPTNGAAAYVGPRNEYGTGAYPEPYYDNGYGPAAYVGPGGYRCGPATYVNPSYGCAYEPSPCIEPGYGHGYGPRPCLAPTQGYGCGPAVSNLPCYNEARPAYVDVPPPRPRVAVPYRRQNEAVGLPLK
jgi:hypothetical protein